MVVWGRGATVVAAWAWLLAFGIAGVAAQPEPDPPEPAGLGPEPAENTADGHETLSYDVMEIHRRLAMALVSASEYAAAWPHVQVLLDAGGDGWWLHLAAAQICLYRLQDYECVETRAQRALALNPSNARAHLLLGQAYQELGRTEEAVGHYRQCLALRPSEVEVAVRLSNLLEDTGQHEQAIGVVAAALQENPREARLMIRLARLIENSDPGYSESLYGLATRYHEEPTLAFGHLIRFYERQGRQRDADAVRQQIDESVGSRSMRPIW